MDWECDEWSECINGIQTRQCEYSKVPQHVQDTQCADPAKSPTTSQSCEVKAQTPSTGLITSTQSESKSTAASAAQPASNAGQASPTGLIGISGAVTKVLSNPNAVRELKLGSLLAVLVVGLGIFFYYRFFRLKT